MGLNQYDASKPFSEFRTTFGRRPIYVDEAKITKANVVEVVKKVMETHNTNASEIHYLRDVYKGKHDILKRIKQVRADINNKVVVNYPYRIVSFKTGYFLGDPIQYVARNSEDHAGESIAELNNYMLAESKPSEDTDLTEDIYVSGVGYRYVIEKSNESDKNEAPFETTVLDPEYTFVAYDRSYRHNQVLCGTYYKTDNDMKTYYTVYTDNKVFWIEDDKVIDSKPYYGNYQPIIEYRFNRDRMGAFEPVLSMIHAIDVVASDRVNGIAQFVQAFMKARGLNIDAEGYNELKEQGLILLPPDGDIEYVIAQLNQSETQTLVDYMYQSILEICGMPNRNGGSSTSDTGTAVILRDGFSDAESYARRDEMSFRKSEQVFLKRVIEICNTQRDTGLTLGTIDIHFTRRNYENIEAKVSTLVAALGCDKIHPKLAWEMSNAVPDVESAYQMSQDYIQQKIEEDAEKLEQATQLAIQNEKGMVNNEETEESL